jgi:WD40 repeat protein
MDQRNPSAEEGMFSIAFIPRVVLNIVDCSQIMDLENRNASLQEEVSMSPTKRAALQTDWVPRAPAAYTLTGHRDQVLRVAFHPSYNIIASASDDSTVKIWDWETGEFERTLKGHTRSVNDVDFDSKGNLLGKSRPLRYSISSAHEEIKSLVRRICSSKYGTLKTTGRT